MKRMLIPELEKITDKDSATVQHNSLKKRDLWPDWLGNSLNISPIKNRWAIVKVRLRKEGSTTE